MLQSFKPYGNWKFTPVKSCHLGTPTPLCHTEYCGSTYRLIVFPLENFFHTLPPPRPMGMSLILEPELNDQRAVLLE